MIFSDKSNEKHSASPGPILFPLSFDLPGPAPLQLVLLVVLDQSEHKNRILAALRTLLKNSVRHKANFLYPDPCGTRFKHEPQR